MAEAGSISGALVMCFFTHSSTGYHFVVQLSGLADATPATVSNTAAKPIFLNTLGP